MKTENDLTQSIESKLKALNAEILHKVGYPRHGKKLLDYIARKDREVAFVKSIQNVNTLGTIFKELKRLSCFLNVNALVIADKFNDEPMLDGVLHIRDRVGVVKIDTLNGITKGDKVYVYEYKGMYYVKIDGEKLRGLRIRKGYGLRELARTVGASIKALQMYEEGLIDMSIEKAYRFMELFAEEFEEVLKEVDIFRDRIIDPHTHRRSTVPKEDEDKQKLLEAMSCQGAEAEAFNHLPSDIIVNKDGIRIFMTIIDNNIDAESAITKAKENRAFSRLLDGIATNIVKDSVPSELVKEIENYGTTLKYETITRGGLKLERELF
uniref:Putative HTH-type transcriptional regulatory protein ENO77_02220 n=1 Tax=Ignisphaera aggregans TaxID=334771 RepID=A0A7C2VB32_9CREN